MKAIIFMVVATYAVATSTPLVGSQYKIADKDLLRKQKDVLFLMYRINQDSLYPEFVDIAKSFKIVEENYEKPEVVKDLLFLRKYGPLPRGAIFSIFTDEHMEEAIALFKVFYYAKTYEIFYKTAAWARQTVNEGLFLYSYSVAIVHRPDTYGVILPPIYEIYPYYFFSSDVIERAQFYKQIHEGGKDVSTSAYNGYTIIGNYSGHYFNLHPEQSLSYFMEDVGMNSWYYSWHIHFPFWMNGEEFGLNNDRRGEMYYFIHQQILARYYLERLSHGFGEIPFFNFELPVETSYTPSLKYQNGIEFPSRPKFANLYEYYYTHGQSWSFKSKYGYGLTYMKGYLDRVTNTIDSGIVLAKSGKMFDLDETPDGFNILGNIIQSNPDSPNPRFYGNFESILRHLLGYGFQPLDATKAVPSALEHFETSMRDPAFYQLFKRIVLKFQRHMSYKPRYMTKNLEFPGVKIQKVEFDDLVTFFDTSYSDLSYAVFGNPEDLEKDTFKVRVGQQRLNHKPFTYKIKVKSNKDVDASVRIFLGPKYDQYDRYINMTENRINFVLFDHFVFKLKAGDNLIKRNSYESKFYGPDKTPYRELYDQVMAAYEDDGEFNVDGKQNYFYMPRRMILPKGKPEGMPFQFMIVVSEYKPYKGQKSDENIYFYPKVGSGGHFDGYSLGYPLDRFIDFDGIYTSIPNIHFYETKIYHKKVEDINSV